MKNENLSYINIIYDINKEKEDEIGILEIILLKIIKISVK